MVNNQNDVNVLSIYCSWHC